jgi:hypothetical protein
LDCIGLNCIGWAGGYALESHLADDTRDWYAVGEIE